MWFPDSAALPLLPGLVALGVVAFALFLAGSALSAHRFLVAANASSGWESGQAALFALGAALAHLPAVLPVFLAPPAADLAAAGWALAAASAALLPGGRWRGGAGLLALALGVGLLLAASAGRDLAPLLALAALLYLERAGAVAGLHRALRLGMAGGLLAAAATALAGVAVAAALQITVLAMLAFLLWRGAGATRMGLRHLALALALFPALLALAGQWLLREEEGFRASQRDEAHLRLELAKDRLESMDAHGLDLLKILATDQLTRAALARPHSGHDFSFRLLARRIGAESLWLLDPAGHPLAASSPERKFLPQGDQPYFRKALAGIANVHYRHGEAPRQAWSYVARPLLDEHAEIRAIIVARFNLEDAIGDNARMDDILMHRDGVVLMGPGGLEHGILFPLPALTRTALTREIPGLDRLPALGHLPLDQVWVADAAGRPWMWASVPLPGGTWLLSKKISTAPLLDFRQERLLLLLLAIGLLLLLGLHTLQNSTFVHLLLGEVEQRRRAEARERQAREEAESGNRELTRHRLHLETLVAERTRELEELNRDLDRRVHDEIAKRKEQESLLIHQSRLAAMGEMIAAIAHQWRQPLNALSLVLQNIRMQHRMGLLTEPSMDRMQEKSEQLVQRMSATIDEFRNFFKPRGQVESFPLATAVRSAAGILEGVFRNHGIRFELECDESLELAGIPGEFSQVMLNLLANAKDAVLETRRPDPAIQVRASRERESVVITVEDNGGGIPAAILPRIFEPYFTTKEEGKGSGIGLYMSKMIVENNMNGRLEADNTEVGARFRVVLPAASDGAPPALPEQPAQ